MNPSRRLAQWLGGHLAQYVDDVDNDKLQAGLWDGDLLLQDLHIRSDAPRKLRLPLVLRQGAVEKIRLQVPWKTFASGRASLSVAGVTLVLEPLGNAIYDERIEEAIRAAVFAQKQ
ncbi:unnamed protein product, partial [Choristocarpus tenellus]